MHTIETEAKRHLQVLKSQIGWEWFWEASAKDYKLLFSYLTCIKPQFDFISQDYRYGPTRLNHYHYYVFKLPNLLLYIQCAYINFVPISTYYRPAQPDNFHAEWGGSPFNHSFRHRQTHRLSLSTELSFGAICLFIHITGWPILLSTLHQAYCQAPVSSGIQSIFLDVAR